MLNKNELLTLFVSAIKESGWDLQYPLELPHPLELTISNGEEDENLRVYMWNITHGGAHRSKDEYRIQITGVEHLLVDDEHKTLLLGAAQLAENNIFVAFDASIHRTFGSSPSIQVRMQTINQAIEKGMAIQEKSRSGDGKINEIVIAMKPEFLIDYIRDFY